MDKYSWSRHKAVTPTSLFIISLLIYSLFISTRRIPEERSTVSLKTEMESDPVVFKEWYIENGDFRVFVTSLDSNAPSEKSVVLLHGMKFTSQNWKAIGTFEALEKEGFKVFAIDLPGYGKSKLFSDITKAKVLEEVLDKLKLEQTILVSPSMSGTFSIPFLLQHPERLHGYVPVAPVIPSEYGDGDFKKSEVPTLVVYGENDQFALSKNKLLQQIQNSTTKMIPNGSHPCYLDNPELFHKFIIDYFKSG